MQQMLRVLLYHDINRVKQPLEIAFLHKRSPEVGHDEVSHEQDTLVRQMDEHSIVGFASLDRDEVEARSPDLQLGATVDRDVRFEAAYVIQAEALAEEAFSKDPGGVEFALNFFVIVAPGIDAQARI